MLAKPITHNLPDSQQKAEFAEHVKRIKNQIHAASDIDQILLDLRREILSLSMLKISPSSRSIRKRKRFSPKSLTSIASRKSAFPITEQSLAGFCAKYLGPVNIADAYNIAELQGHPPLPRPRHQSYDKRTGFKTKQVLTYPIVADNKYLMGVFQLLNKKSGGTIHQKR